MFLKGYPLEAKTAPKNWNQSVHIWKSEKQKEDKKLSIYLNFSCSLYAEYLWYIRKCF